MKTRNWYKFTTLNKKKYWAFDFNLDLQVDVTYLLYITSKIRRTKNSVHGTVAIAKKNHMLRTIHTNLKKKTLRQKTELIYPFHNITKS